MPDQIVANDGNTFTFLAMRVVEGGFFIEQTEPQEEELTTPGVDGKRWRTTGNQHVPIVVETISEATAFLGAQDLARNMKKAKGQLVIVNHTVDGASYKFKDVHVSGVVPVPMKGAPVGGGASGSSTAHVRTMWTLELTTFVASANS